MFKEYLVLLGLILQSLYLLLFCLFFCIYLFKTIILSFFVFICLKIYTYLVTPLFSDTSLHRPFVCFHVSPVLWMGSDWPFWPRRAPVIVLPLKMMLTNITLRRERMKVPAERWFNASEEHKEPCVCVCEGTAANNFLSVYMSSPAAGSTNDFGWEHSGAANHWDNTAGLDVSSVSLQFSALRGFRVWTCRNKLFVAEPQSKKLEQEWEKSQSKIN